MRFIPTPGSFEAQSRWSQSSPPDHWGPSGYGPTLATPAEAWSRLTDQYRCAATEVIEARHLAHTCTVEECTGTEVIPYEYSPTGELHLDVMVAGWWWSQQHRTRDPHLMRLLAASLPSDPADTEAWARAWARAITNISYHDWCLADAPVDDDPDVAARDRRYGALEQYSAWYGIPGDKQRGWALRVLWRLVPRRPGDGRYPAVT